VLLEDGVSVQAPVPVHEPANFSKAESAGLPGSGASLPGVALTVTVVLTATSS
jgi:hypothetical protein